MPPAGSLLKRKNRHMRGCVETNKPLALHMHGPNGTPIVYINLLLLADLSPKMPNFVWPTHKKRKRKIVYCVVFWLHYWRYGLDCRHILLVVYHTCCVIGFFVSLPRLSLDDGRPNILWRIDVGQQPISSFPSCAVRVYTYTAVCGCCLCLSYDGWCLMRVFPFSHQRWERTVSASGKSGQLALSSLAPSPKKVNN